MRGIGMRFKVAALAVFLAPMLMPVAAQAYDPLCDKIQKPERRALCQCRSDAGAQVSRRPNNDGRMIVDAGRPPKKRIAEVGDCMIKKGYKPE